MNDLNRGHNDQNDEVDIPESLMQWTREERNRARFRLKDAASRRKEATARQPDTPSVEGPSEAGIVKAAQFDGRLISTINAVLSTMGRHQPIPHLQPYDLPPMRREDPVETIARHLPVYLAKAGIDAGRYAFSIRILDNMKPNNPAAIGLPEKVELDGRNECELLFSRQFMETCDIFDLMLATAHEVSHIALHEMIHGRGLGALGQIPLDVHEESVDTVGVLMGLGTINCLRVYRNRRIRIPAANGTPDRMVAQYHSAGYASAMGVGFAIGAREKAGLESDSFEQVMKFYGVQFPEQNLFRVGADKALREVQCA